MAVTTTKSFTATTNATTTTFGPIGIELNNQDDLDVYISETGYNENRVLQLKQSTASTADANHPQVGDTTGLYWPAISSGTSLKNYTISADNNNIIFNSALPSGAVVSCERRTRDGSSDYTNFSGGSTIRSTTLNTALDEVRFTAQDARNRSLANEKAIDAATRGVTSNATSDKEILFPDSSGHVMLNNLRQDAIFIGTSEGIINKADVGGDLTASYNANTDKAEFTVVNVSGSNITSDIEVKAGKAIKFEGATDDAYETTLQAEDPTADNVISLPNATGTIMLDNLRHHAIIIGESNGTGNKADVGGDLTAAYNPNNDKAEFTIINDAVTSAKIDENAVTTHHIADSTILHTNLANDCVTRAKLDHNLVVQNEEVSGHTADNNTIYTTQAVHDHFYRKTGSPDEVIKSSETWPTDGTKDNFVATPGAIDGRIVSLVEEVGGFVAIDNETSFPNTNPDINDGAGTIVSIKALANAFTSSGSGVATIANGTIGNSTVTINGLANSTTYGAGLGMLVETTSTLNTYKYHRQTANAADLAVVAAKSTEIGRLGTADAVADMAILGTTDCVADMAILGTTDVVADLNTLGTTDVVSDLDTVAGIAANVTTVAGISSNVTTTANNATSISTCANNISDVNNFGDLYQIGTSTPTNDGGGNALAAGDMWFDSSSNKTLKVHNGTAFQSVSPAQSVLDDISIVSGSLTRQEDNGSITDSISSGSGTGSLDTCATNITNINTFANVYRIASSAPGDSLDEGDLWYDSTANKLKYYNGSAWTVTAGAGLSAVSDDTSPELTGHLDCNDKNLTEVATVSGDNLQIDFGTIA